MNCYPCSFGVWNKEISESMNEKSLREIWKEKNLLILGIERRKNVLHALIDSYVRMVVD